MSGACVTNNTFVMSGDCVTLDTFVVKTILSCVNNIFLHTSRSRDEGASDGESKQFV